MHRSSGNSWWEASLPNGRLCRMGTWAEEVMLDGLPPGLLLGEALDHKGTQVATTESSPSENRAVAPLPLGVTDPDFTVTRAGNKSLSISSFVLDSRASCWRSVVGSVPVTPYLGITSSRQMSSIRRSCFRNKTVQIVGPSGTYL